MPHSIYKTMKFYIFSILFLISNEIYCQKNQLIKQYLITDESNHFTPKVNKCELLDIEDDEFLQVIYELYNDEFHSTHNRLETAQRLSSNQKSFYYWFYFNQFITNHQLDEFIISNNEFLTSLIQHYLESFNSEETNRYFMNLEKFINKNKELIYKIKNNKD